MTDAAVAFRLLLSTISFQGGLASVTPWTPHFTISQNISVPAFNMILRSGYVFLYELTATVYVVYSLATHRCTVWKTGQPGLALTVSLVGVQTYIGADFTE